MAKARLPERMVETLIKNHNIDFSRTSSGKHIKFTLVHKGKRKLIVVPGTLSDYRGTLNLYAEVRRTVRELGVPFVEDKALIRK
jgi:hypothetical protein